MGRITERYIHAIMAVGLPSAVGTLPRRDDLDPLVRDMIEASGGVSGEDYAAAMAEMSRRARTAAAAFADLDLLLSPTAAKGPPAIGQHREVSAPQLFAVWESYVPFPTMWNWTGQPAISLPLGTDDAGLPVGMQFVGQTGDEATLFRLAGQLGMARPWAHKILPYAG